MDKVPSTGQCRVQIWKDTIYPSGYSTSEFLGKLTFNKRADAEAYAKQRRAYCRNQK